MQLDIQTELQLRNIGIVFHTKTWLVPAKVSIHPSIASRNIIATYLILVR